MKQWKNPSRSRRFGSDVFSPGIDCRKYYQERKACSVWYKYGSM